MKFRNVKGEKVNVRFDSPNGHHYWKWVKPNEVVEMPDGKIEYAKNLGFEPVEEPEKPEALKSEIADKLVETKRRK